MTTQTLVFEQLNPEACRTYLVACNETKHAALIDPVLASSNRYLELIRRMNLELRWVVDTHTHADHLSGASYLAATAGATYAMHKKSGADTATHRLTDGSQIKVGKLRLDVLETPGHTKDSISLVLPGRVLTGDWLFIGGAGRTDLPGGDPGEHWDALSRVIPKLDETSLVYPGHDYQGKQSSSLTEEKKHNMNLAPRSREAYVAWLHGASQEPPDWMIQTIRANNDSPMDLTLNFMPADATAACMCQPSLGSTGIVETQPEDIKAMVEDPSGRKDRLLLDVRQPEEYTGPLGHVPGATLIPLGELSSRLGEIDEYKDKTVIAICKSGGRSAKACEILINAGFASVLNLAGGTQSWNQKGFAVDR